MITSVADMFSSRRTKSKTPQVLSGTDIGSLAEYIKSDQCQSVMLMLGAGVSTAAGIPDFRSPDTGLYANLAKLNLPYPEAVFEINFFRRNPVPFYTLAHELYPGKFRPTLTHSFILLLSQKNRLHTCFTQNIDTLERRAGVPEHKLIEAHGSFANQRCVNCKREYDGEKMKDHVKRKAVAKCEDCGGYIKPDIVFFGEGLPPRFSRAVPNLVHADLLIVMGTSLTVHPFASLAELVVSTCPRVLINLDQVGDFGSRSDDVVLLGKCDDIVRDLCRELGWEAELDELWQATEASVVTEPMIAPPKEERKKETEETTLLSEVKNQAALEAVEARLAKLSVKEEKEENIAQASGSDAIATPEPDPAAAMARKVAKEVSSAMKDTAEFPVKEEQSDSGSKASHQTD